MGILSELVFLGNGSAASGDRLAADICREAIREIERLQSIIDENDRVIEGLMAELEQQQAFKKEIDEAVKSSMDERCDAYERHCTCVPVLRAKLNRLQVALLSLKNGDCWCDRYYDPSCGHQDRCNQAREAAEAAKGKSSE